MEVAQNENTEEQQHQEKEEGCNRVSIWTEIRKEKSLEVIAHFGC